MLTIFLNKDQWLLEHGWHGVDPVRFIVNDINGHDTFVVWSKRYYQPLYGDSIICSTDEAIQITKILLRKEKLASRYFDKLFKRNPNKQL